MAPNSSAVSRNHRTASLATDTRLRGFTGTRLTTCTGVHGTIQGPRQLTELAKTTDGASTGAVLAGSSAPVSGGQDFGIWLRHR